MKSIKIKETYLLMLIVIGLISLSLYSTYALFTASTTINDVVGFNATLTTDSNILEYEIVTVPAGETKIIELNITNSYDFSLYYGAWYNIINPIDTSDISVGLYTEKNSNPSSGQLTSGSTISLLVGISNYSTSEAVVNIGTVGSLTSNLNLSENRILLPSGWDASIVVTEQYLEDHTTTENVNLEYTTAEMTEVTLDPGIYLLETWGAEGGSASTSAGAGGLGGYSYGTLTLYETTPTYVYVGGKSTINSVGTSSGGFNGGGKGTYYGGSGGGASDIRIGTDSLYARVIVAGGGGGAQGRANTTYQADGGFGGGTTGGDGEYYNGNTSTTYNGKGATLTAGGAAGDYSTSPAEAGTFGQGGAAGAHSSSTIRGLGAGGGGWYGGGGGAYRYAGGGGGSGFVYTEENAVYTDSSYTGGTWLLDSRYYLTNAATIGDGTTTFTDFDGTSVTGHSGAGAVRISGNKIFYSIPTINGLTHLTVGKGTSVDLTSGVTAICAYGETGCSLSGTSITDTSTLEIGEYTIYYLVTSSSGVVYKYARTLTISNNLNLYQPGVYVKYVGNNGCTGNYCSGYNANQTDTSGTTFGYCNSSSYQFTTYGWRIAYIDGGNTYLVSAGAPECIKNSTYEQMGPFSSFAYISSNNEYMYGRSYSFDSSTGYFTLSSTSTFDFDSQADTIVNTYKYTCLNEEGTCTELYEITGYEWKSEDDQTTYNDKDANVYYNSNVNTLISTMNSESQKYCNTTYAAGGTCSSSNTWAIGNNDFKKITYGLYGTSNNLTSVQGTPHCYSTSSQVEESCGYNNDLISNGGYYWFADYYTNNQGIYWSPNSNPSRVSYTSAISTYNYGIRPIIKLSSSVYVTGGTGTMSDPYTISIE